MISDDKQKATDSCPKQEVDVQEGCGPCGSTACDTEEDAGCDTCG